MLDSLWPRAQAFEKAASSLQYTSQPIQTQIDRAGVFFKFATFVFYIYGEIFSEVR